MSTQYEVLSPWADVDPIPLKGLASRISDFEGKTIGLLAETYKVASRPMLAVVEQRLKERYPSLKFKWFDLPYSLVAADQERAHDKFMISPQFKSNFENWAREIDAAVLAVGD